MANTPSLPIWGPGAPVAAYWYEASRVIPTALQPNFGIAPSGVYPGVGPKPNAFYNRNLQYTNQSPYGYPALYLNMPVNRYSASIQGLMNLQNNSGVRG